MREFKSSSGLDVQSDKGAIQRVREAAEKAKIELSATTSTDIHRFKPVHVHSLCQSLMYKSAADMKS